MKNVLLINGPNLNMLGSREPELYGSTKLSVIENTLAQIFAQQDVKLTSFQSNHEGAIIEFIHAHLDADWIIINPAGFSHTSVVLLDALKINNIPFIEVHITNIYARESFRHKSLLSAAAVGTISGLGVLGYELAAQAVLNKIQTSN